MQSFPASDPEDDPFFIGQEVHRADADLGKQDVQDAAVAGAEEEGEDHDCRDGGNDVGVVGSHPEEAPEMADLSDERRNDDRHAKTDEQ